jgi:arabinan endo-1,5-alpha-L-arabinosidase
VFTERPAWVADAVPGNRGLNFWAPDVFHLKDKYLLYYAVSTFGSRTSGIGLVTNPTLDPNDPNYKWTDQGLIVRTQQGINNYNAIDPAVVQEADGKLWLVFGSFWEGIKLVQLDPATGLRIAPDSPITELAHYSSIEAAYIYFHDGYYYLFVNWGRCCQGVNSTYNIRVGRSKTITGPYLDMAGKDLAHEGGTLFLETRGNFIGPGHAGIIKVDDQYWLSCHFYDGATARGTSRLAVLPLAWNKDGWPTVVPLPAALTAKPAVDVVPIPAAPAVPQTIPSASANTTPVAPPAQPPITAPQTPSPVLISPPPVIPHRTLP